MAASTPTLGKATPLVLQFHSQTSMSAVSGEGKNGSGQKVQRFKKDLISVGVYTHPVHGRMLDTTTERMDGWIATFNRMLADGERVPVVQDHSVSAETTLGYVVELFREGDQLYGIHELVGEDQIDLATRVNQVSVGISREFVGGNGTLYGEAIEHVGVTPEPVVADQGGFVAIAASRSGQKQAALFVLATDREQGAKPMDKEMLAKLREMLGAGEDLKEDNVLSRIEERLKLGADEKAQLDTKVNELMAEIEKLKASRETDGDKPKKLDPDVEDGLVEGAESRLSRLVERGKITPAVRDKLLSVLVGKAGNRNVHCLSRHRSGTERSVIADVCDALADNDLVELGEQTGAQVKLARSTETKTQAQTPEQALARARAVQEHAGVKIPD